MIRAVVIECQLAVARHLAALLEDTWQVEVIGIATESVTGWQLCTELCPDAVFLNVDSLMANSLSFAIALSKRERSPRLIFTAKSPDRATDAFRLEAVDYLLKPWDPVQVAETVDRLVTCLRPCRREWPDSGPRDRTSLTSGKLGFADTANDLLPVTGADRDQIRLLSRREIVAVLRKERRTWIHTVLEEFSTYYPLIELMDWLGSDLYIQVGRHAAINLRAIAEIEPGDRIYRLRLNDRLGTEVITSRAGAVRLAAGMKIEHQSLRSLKLVQS